MTAPRPRRPRPAFVLRGVMLTPDQDAWLREQAKLEERSISSFTRRLLDRERQRAEQEPEPAIA